MALKFTVHTDGIKAIGEAVANSCSRAEHTLAMQVEKDTAPFVPMLTGSLRGMKSFIPVRMPGICTTASSMLTRLQKARLHEKERQKFRQYRKKI